jgi:hypothetical protein
MTLSCSIPGVSPDLFLLTEKDTYPFKIEVCRYPFVRQRNPFLVEIIKLLNTSGRDRFSHDGSDINTISKLSYPSKTLKT